MATLRDKSPFPGMDPYLEADWESVHGSLITLLGLALNEVLPEDLVARPEKRVVLGYGEEDDPDAPPPRRDRQVKADLRVVAENYAEPAEGRGATATLARPGTLAIPVLSDPLEQKSVTIREADGERVVTVVEMISPWNKRGPGREEFLDRRSELLDAGANVVEIDLVRAGDWRALFTEPALLPRRLAETAYRATARLAEADESGNVLYLTPMSLRRPLPALPVPLRRGETPAVVELQASLDRVYAGNRYGRPQTYARPLRPPLNPDDAAWADALLREFSSTTA